MPITNEIIEAMDAIDRRISKLQDLKKQLAEEFGVQDGRSARRTSVDQKPLFARSGDKTRKEQLAEFLKANGPKTRKEIIDQAGLPAGTVAFCLNDDTRFAKSGDGKWGVVRGGEQELK